MMKRGLSLILAVCLMVVGLPLSASSASSAWNGTSKVAVTVSGNTYKVSSGAELAWIADQNNNGNRSFEGKTIVLTEDLNLNNKEFTPIGTESKPFKGSFDGNGYSITGLNVKQSGNGDQHGGLFGYVSGNNLSFSNISLENCYIDVNSVWRETNSSPLIGIVSLTSGGKLQIENVKVSGNIKDKGGNYGGIIGQAKLSGRNTVTLKDIESKVTISALGGDGIQGGLVGLIVDSNNSSIVNIESCTSNSSVAGVRGYFAYSSIYSGLIIGKFEGGTLSIDRCAATGSASSKGYYTYCGGFAGSVIAKKLTISDSYVNATLSSDGTDGGSVVGGFLGELNCKGTVSESIIKNCYVTGTLTSTLSGGALGYTAVGTFIANNWSETDSITLQNCYYNSSLGTGAKYIYKVCYVNFGVKNVSSPGLSSSLGRTVAQMKQASYYKNWDFDSIWMIEGSNYPVLKAKTVIASYNDEYIIKQVHMYTDRDFVTGYLDTWEKAQTGCSDEEKFVKMRDYLASYGYLDVREGIDYVNKSSKLTWDYSRLIDSDMYGAFQLYKYLREDPKGKFNRGILWLDGLVFSNELSDYLDPLTYTDVKNFPAVSKCMDVLYEFLDYETLKIQQIDAINTIRGIASNATDYVGLAVDDLVDKINNCRSSTEFTKLLQSAEAKGVYINLSTSVENGKRVIEYKVDDSKGFGQFQKGLSSAGKILKGFSIGADFLGDMINLDSKLATMNEYKKFLIDVRDWDLVPFEMRLAAQRILQELEGGIWDEFEQLALDIIDLTSVTGIVKDAGLEKLLGKTGATSFGEIQIVAAVTSWCINQVADIDSLVKGTAYAESYAALGVLYSQKLADSKTKFLRDDSPENAWEFFENYNILQALRYLGEKAFQKARTLQPDLLSNFIGEGWWAGANATVNGFVESNIQMIEDCAFQLSEDVVIPDSVQYLKKSIFSCPVDVIVLTPTGEQIAYLEDGVETDIRNEYGRFSVVYRPTSDTYSKVICFLQDIDFTIEAVGQDEGLVNFETAVIDNKTSLFHFSNEPIEPGSTIVINSDEMLKQGVYSVKVDDTITEKTIDDFNSMDEPAFVQTSSISLSDNNIIMAQGQSMLLTVSVLPDNASNKNVSWISNNPGIASVKDGKISAVSPGQASIYCIAGGASKKDVLDICEVSVLRNKAAITGLSAQNAVYNSTPHPGYTGIPTSDYSGDYDIHYDGRNDTTYDSDTAPTNAGDYSVTISVPETDHVYTGSVSLEFSITKGNQNAPTTPTLVSKSYNSVTLSAGESSSGGAVVEYSIDNGSHWQTGTTFNDLSADTEYDFAARYAGNENYEPSPASTVLKVTTDAEPTATPTPAPSGPVTPPVSPVTPLPEPTEELNPEPTEEPSLVISFTDVSESAWYFDAVYYCRDKGYFYGTSSDYFSPNNTMTRAMFATVLYRIAGEPKVSGTNPFADVDTGTWYSNAILWASNEKIIEGYGNGRFGTTDPVTREQMVALFWRYNGKPISETEDLSKFTDAGIISSWAKAAMNWAVSVGIINGKGNGILDPKSSATRAEVAQIVMNYDTKVEK